MVTLYLKKLAEMMRRMINFFLKKRKEKEKNNLKLYYFLRLNLFYTDSFIPLEWVFFFFILQLYFDVGNITWIAETY